MKRIFIFLIYLLLVALTSCKSSQHLIKQQTTQLTRQFGFPVHKKDDLRLYTEASQWLGVPYQTGGTTRKGVDCSGLVVRIYRQTYNKQLERTTTDIAARNCRKITKNNLRTGDLVFFNTSRKTRKGINHVGIFLKQGYFIHASSSKGVIVSNLKEDYYRKTWKQGGRVK